MANTRIIDEKAIKMKRMIFCLALTFVMAIIPFLFGTAKGEPEDFPEFCDSKELGDIEIILTQSEMIKKGGILGDSVDLSHIVSAYKVFHYDPKTAYQFIDDLIAGKGFMRDVSGDYHWMVITDENAAIKVVWSSKQWEVAGFRHPSSTGKPSADIRRDVFEKALTGIDAEYIKAFEVSTINTTFLYVQTKETVYVVPFSSRPDFNLLENGKRYTPEEAGEILRMSDYYTSSLKPGQIGGGGTAPTPIWPVIIVIAILLAIALGVIVVIKKRKANTR